ncbi:hypothetical protein Tco_0014900 [Tanacetum coccineum]
MEEYIRLKEEKAQKHGNVVNWETTKYGKIWYDDDVHDLRSIETEFPAIVFNDNLTSNETLSREPTIEVNYKMIKAVPAPPTDPPNTRDGSSYGGSIGRSE